MLLRRHLVRHTPGPGPRRRSPGLRERFRRKRVFGCRPPLGGRVHPRYDRLQRHGAARVQSDGQLQLWTCNRNITTEQPVPGASRRFRNFRLRGCECEGGRDHRKWNGSGLSWTTGDAIELKLTDSHANATGQPTISGVPQVGKVLNGGHLRHRRRRRPAGDIHLPVGADRHRQHGERISALTAPTRCRPWTWPARSGST